MQELITGNVPTKERAKPEFVTVGNRQVISSGRWNDELMVEYIKDNGQDRWIKIGELARVAWGQNTIDHKRRVRTYLNRIWKMLLQDKDGPFLLSVEYDAGNWALDESGHKKWVKGHHPAQAVKLYDPSKADEREALIKKVNKMLASRELTVDLYKKAKQKLSPDDECEEEAA